MTGHSCTRVPAGDCLACQGQERARDEVDARAVPALRGLVAALIDQWLILPDPARAALDEAEAVLEFADTAAGVTT